MKLAFEETIALMKSVYPYLIIGAAIGAIIHGLVPTEWISTAFGDDHWWLIPIAAIVGISIVYTIIKYDPYLTDSYYERDGIRSCYGYDD